MRANRLPLLPSHAGTHSRWRETALLERTREREPQCVTGASEGVDEGSSGCRGGIRSRRITHQRMGNKIMEAADAQREKGIRSRVTDESSRHPRMQSLHLHYANEQTLTHTRRSCTSPPVLILSVTTLADEARESVAKASQEADQRIKCANQRQPQRQASFGI